MAGAAGGELFDSPSARSDVIAASAGGGAASGSLRKVAGSGSFGFRHMGGDRIHQGWRQAIIGLESEFLETRTDPGHLVRFDAGLDHGRYEGRKSRRGRALLLEQFGMDEVEAIERMRLVLDAPVHMGAADLAGVPLDCRRSVDDLKLVAVLKHTDAVAWHHRDYREDRSCGFPAFGAAAGVVVGDITLDADLDRLAVLAFADQGATGKAARTLLDPAVDRWVDMNSHRPILLVFDVSKLEHDDRTDRLALVHQIEAPVDLLQLEDVRDHRIDLDLSVHVPVDDFRHVGAAARAAERRAFPDPPGHELERPGCNFLAGFGDPDHHGDAPTAVAGLQCLAHHGGIAGAVEGVVGAAVGEPDQMRDDVATDLRRIDEMGHAEAAAPFLLGIVKIDPDDLVGAHHPAALNDVEPDPAKPEHHHVGARRDLGGVDHSTDARRHAAADVAALVERRVLADLGDGDFRQHGKVRESRASHVVEDRLALIAKARGAVRHQPLALGGADRGAEIGFLAQAAFALAAFRRVKRDHMIARLHRNHACADLANNAGALMTEDRRKDSFAVEAVKGVGVGVADAGRLDFNQDFAGLWPIEIKLDDFKQLLCFECDSGACLHLSLSLKTLVFAISSTRNDAHAFFRARETATCKNPEKYSVVVPQSITR